MTTRLDLDAIERTVYHGLDSHLIKQDLIRECRFLRSQLDYYEQPVPRETGREMELRLDNERRQLADVCERAPRY